ncbi:hypothetical protein E2320_012972, partial [Naja naja]
MVNTMHEP